MEKVNIIIKFFIFKFLAYIDNFDFSDRICPKRIFLVEKVKIGLVRASMVVTYYIKLFRTEIDRHNGILMSLLLLVVQPIITSFIHQ